MSGVIDKIFCIKCKEKTDNNDSTTESKTDKNGKTYNMLKATCSCCGCRKNKFTNCKTVNDTQNGR